MPPRSPQTYTTPSPLPSVSGSITLKAITDLPARLYGGNAQAVEVSGLDYTLHLDIQKLAIADAATAADKWTVVWDAAANTYERIEFTNLPMPSIAWGAISGKPATFPPEVHTHVIADTTGLQTALDGKVAKTGDTMTGVLAINNATASTSTTTGALTVAAGGIGVAGSGWFGNAVVVDNPTVPSMTWRRAGVNRWSIVTSGATGDALVIHNNAASAGVQLATQAATAWSAFSDISLKDNLQPQSVRERMRGGDYWFGGFDWKYDGHRGVGVTAQSFATVFPEWVDDIDGKLAVQEAKAGLAALAYAKEVDDELTELRKELKALRARVAELEKD